MDGLFTLVIIVYLICHLPAIVMLVLGLKLLKTNVQKGKILIIIAGIYFIIGAGICGGMFL